MNEDLFYKIALIQTPRVGPVTARNLYQHYGSAKAIFEADLTELLLSQLVNKDAAKEIKKKEMFKFAEEELTFIQKFNIQPITIGDANYPRRMKNLDDAPFLLYYKGETNLNAPRVIAIIGTRKPTEYGRAYCDKIVDGLKAYNVMIVSGLAFGIDGAAHSRCVEKGIKTVGVVAHGLDRLYPPAHKKLAQRMIQQGGGLITEFPSRTEPMAGNFPMRNRIIAGMADAVIVVETAKSGGSIITANIANEYQKDVFAIPGKLGETYSEGCNNLIKTHRASLLTDVEDIAYILRWEKQEAATQKKLFIELNDDERFVIDLLFGGVHIHLNQLILQTQLSTSKLAAVLLELEMKGVIKAMPGKYYRLI
jgi:DNA processing protein